MDLFWADALAEIGGCHHPSLFRENTQISPKVSRGCQQDQNFQRRNQYDLCEIYEITQTMTQQQNL